MYFSLDSAPLEKWSKNRKSPRPGVVCVCVCSYVQYVHGVDFDDKNEMEIAVIFVVCL